MILLLKMRFYGLPSNFPMKQENIAQFEQDVWRVTYVFEGALVLVLLHALSRFVTSVAKGTSVRSLV